MPSRYSSGPPKILGGPSLQNFALHCGAKQTVRRWVGTREELRALICDRRDALDVSHETIDAISGLADGYTSKILAPDPIRNFGPESLRAILGALALGIARVEIVEDPQAAAKVAGRWTPRKRHRRPKPPPRCV